MDDRRLHFDMHQRTERFEKNTGLICSPPNRSVTPFPFPVFYHSTLAPNHPFIPITSLTKLELTGGFFFPPQNITQIGDLEWLPFWWQFIPTAPNHTPSCSNALCLHALVHIIGTWFRAALIYLLLNLCSICCLNGEVDKYWQSSLILFCTECRICV